MLNSLRAVIDHFNMVNADCKNTGESVVPLVAGELDFYQYQAECLLENLAITQEVYDEFIAWLQKQV